MAQFIERLKSIYRRILAVVGTIPILMCLCRFGIFFADANRRRTNSRHRPVHRWNTRGYNQPFSPQK
jgi:hypothetical protein